MKGTELIEKIRNNDYDERFLEIYADNEAILYQKQRYISAIESFIMQFGDADIEVYSAPGRSELGGNHTDHQNGEILAASINCDAIAIVRSLNEKIVKIFSDDYGMITVDIEKLDMNVEEKGTARSLLKGVLYKLVEIGYKTGGFQAYITSDVLIGAGLSSSAAYETLIVSILSGIYNGMKVNAVEMAIIGKYAENVYFGKPCGLMDQIACSVGGLIHVDFATPENPIISKVEFDLNQYGYSLCILDTKGSHADLTEDYAAIPNEMKKIATYFGQKVLLGLTMKDLIKNIDALRNQVGDRGVLRAIHFICENERVRKEVNALKKSDINEFLSLVKESGNSSYKYLQNVYSNSDIKHQNVSLALAISEIILGRNGVCRVHGGGFAGTIQAFVKNDVVSDYQNQMNEFFGDGACRVLKVRKYGGIKVL